jgi:hypothetical protein
MERLVKKDMVDQEETEEMEEIGEVAMLWVLNVLMAPAAGVGQLVHTDKMVMLVIYIQIMFVSKQII